MFKQLARVCLAALLLAFSFAVPAREACPPVGAIRWDAWFGPQGSVGQAVEKSLSPNRWHDRLPTCAREVGADQAAIRCDGQEQMDVEIKQAKESGLSYWAFVAYAEDNPMSLGLQAYLRSKVADKPHFALISDLATWGGSTVYAPVMRRYIKLMGEASYQRTPDGRPMFFLAFLNDEVMASRFGSRAAFGKIIDEFRRSARDAGFGDPYIVLLDGNVARAKEMLRDLRLDAVSAYAVSDNWAKKAAYSQLAKSAARFWSDAESAGMAVVPIAMTGWDRRPRVMNPMPWEKHETEPDAIDRYFEAPTSAELTGHLADAIRFASRSGRTGNAAPAVLVYAWNEFDEGGWLAPTKGTGTARLEAVKQALSQACPVSR